MKKPFSRTGSAARAVFLRRPLPRPVQAAGARHLAEPLESRVHLDATVVFNEVMYHPTGDETALEWVELHNQMAVDMDVSGWRLARGVEYTFPSGTIIKGGAYLVVAVNPTALQTATGYAGAKGPFTGRLANEGETLELRSNNNRLMDELDYGDSGRWPIGPDGGGVSLAKADPHTASGDVANWTASEQLNGTPGARNFNPPGVPVVETLIGERTAARYHVPASAALGTTWTATSFDDSSWASGPTGIGFAPTTEAAPVVAYHNLTGAGGTQEYGGSLGHDFRVNTPITVTRLGVFDSGADGLARTLVSQIWTRGGGQKLAELTFTPADPGALVASNRLKSLQSTLVLQPGEYSTVAYGYGPGEPNGNVNVAGPGPSHKVLNDGGGRITFFAPSRYGAAGAYPPNPDHHVAAYSAPTFEFGTGFADLVGTDVRSAMQNANSTAYVRRTFNLADPASINTLSLRMRYDDGFVAYLNGREVARRAAPATPAWNSAATASLTVLGDEAIDLAAHRDALLPGNNVLAVHGLNTTPADGDFLVMPHLTATRSAAAAKVALNEVGAPGGGFFVELINTGTAAAPLGGMVVASSAGPAAYTLPAQSLAPGARLVLTGAQLGFSPAAGDRLFLYAGGRTRLVDAAPVDTVLRGRSPEGTGRWLYPSSPTPGGANAFGFESGIVVNEIMYNHRPFPAEPGQVQTTNLIPINGVWKYNQGGQDLGTAWRAASFNDATWHSGAGLLYVEDAALTAPKSTPLTLGANTYYFRKAFNYTPGAAAVQLSLRPFVDDGAVFYLNGQEIYRYNMPDGAVGYGTPATNVADATLTGPVTLPANLLVSGMNVLAVEVHQSAPTSSDIVFGAELSTTVTAVAPKPFRESPEEWVELYNRSGRTIDLTGWRLADGVDYAFPPGTTLGPDQYLVVANDAAALRALYPMARVLGNFTRELSNGDDTVLLLDARGNPADEVHYYDGGRWNAYADGGGSSLELKDPDADNAAPESWAASNELGRTGWRTYTYRGVSTASRGPDGQWREFVMGMLDAGEILLDDIRVTDVTNGASNQLIQNSTFETGMGTWRIAGNHSGEVVVDPSNPNNKVLRLTARGAAEHYLNHAETTFAGGQSIVDGRTYEISYKARWVAGSNQLNTRLYFNRLARTTAIDPPAQSGTPGARNSRNQANAGPTYRDFIHGPIVPSAGQPVTVSVVVEDPEGVASVKLFWKTDSSAWNQVNMTAGAGGKYTGTIPGQASGTVVQFYVQCADAAAAPATSTFPAAGANSRALYKVNDAGTLSGPLHNFRVVMTAADTALLHDVTNVQSADYMGATVVYDEGRVFYDVGAHLKGSLYGRDGDPYFGLVLKFHAEDKFRGVHEQVALDRSGRGPAGSPAQDEGLTRHFLNHVGGIPMFYDDLARVVTPRTYNTSTALLQMGRWTQDSLDERFADGSDGTHYEFEVISWVTQTVDGNPQSKKVFNADRPYINTDVANLGDDKEAYRHMYGIGNNRAEDDFSRMIDMAKAFDLTGPAFDARIREVIDVDQWLRAVGSQALASNWDVWGWGGNSHNVIFYVRPEDNRVLFIPHDIDGALGDAGAPIFGGWASFNKLLGIPAYVRGYLGNLKDMVNNTWNPAYMSYWTSHFGGMVGQDYSGILNFIAARGPNVMNQIRAQVPEVPFRITTNGGNNFNTAQRSVTIAGDAWVDVKQIFIQGRAEPLEVTWVDRDSWTASVPVFGGPNPLVFEARGYRGQLIATDSITVTSSAATPRAADNLRVTEIMYHPADPPVGSPYTDNDFEYVEFQNIGAQPLDVGGSQLLDGLTFVVPAGRTLAPGGYMLIVKNRAAFESRYGTALGSMIAGEFGGSLGNEGDAFRVVGPASEPVLSVSYVDTWHPSTDGSGSSLVKLDPATAAAGTWSVATGWRPSSSANPGGSPGAADPAPAAASVVGRRVFYNNSAFDGNNTAANSADDAAIATDKVALRPGQTATFGNYTGSSKGINGVMIDIANLPEGTQLTALADFAFRVGNDNNPGAWPSAPTPTVNVRRGAGTGGSARVTLTWPDGGIQKQWLQVTVLPNTRTGLTAADVFYFGNTVGETGNSTADAVVSAPDELLTRRSGTAAAAVTNRYDFDRNRRVDAGDQLIARRNATTAATALRLIAAPVAGPAAPAPAPGAGSTAPTPPTRTPTRPAGRVPAPEATPPATTTAVLTASSKKSRSVTTDLLADL